MAKVMSTPKLNGLNETAVRRRLNRTLSAECLKQLDPDGLHVVSFSFPHNDAAELRCGLLLKLREQADPVEAILDMSFEDYNTLLDSEKVIDRLP